jgi:DNA-directed RNA polymerase subunit M/transcription elongation factor TFIIS
VDSALQQNSEAQRNVSVSTEMDSPVASLETKSKKTPKSKKATPVTQAAEIPTSTLGGVPEGAVAREQTSEPRPSETDGLSRPSETDGPAETSESSLRYCPVCENYLFMKVDGEDQQLWRDCRKCGFREKDNKGGLVMEMMIQERSAEGYKILLNEFTRKDPRLPHIRKNIACPNVACDSNRGGHDPDVIYIKYDVVNLMYLYICDICGEQWHSRSRN